MIEPNLDQLIARGQELYEQNRNLVALGLILCHFKGKDNDRNSGQRRLVNLYSIQDMFT